MAAAGGTASSVPESPITIYVFHWRSALPIIVTGVVPRGALGFEALREAVVDAVLASRRMRFTDEQLLSGKLFVADEPDELPPRPTGRPLKPAASVVITDRSCILLDLGERERRGRTVGNGLRCSPC